MLNFTQKSNMSAEKKNISLSLLELNEGQLSVIDPETNRQVGLPRNPRWIRDARFEALKKSIEDAPEMLDLREILVYSLSGIKGKDGRYIVIGGNMRLRALRELGYAEAPCKVLDPATPMEKLREYTIKDNEGFGQNDFDILANEWDGEELSGWGMEASFLGELATFDSGSTPDLTEENYNEPEHEMLECPFCHHRDRTMHFKKVKGGAGAERDSDSVNEYEDLPECN